MDPKKLFGRSALVAGGRTAITCALLAATSAGGLATERPTSDDPQTCSDHTEYRVIELTGYKGMAYAYQAMEYRPAKDSDSDRQTLQAPGKLYPGKVVTAEALTRLIAYYLSQKNENDNYIALSVAQDLDMILSFKSIHKGEAPKFSATEATFYGAPGADKQKEILRDFKEAFEQTGSAIKALEALTGESLQTRMQDAPSIYNRDPLSVENSRQRYLSCKTPPGF